jgi:hypothetical protein
LEGARKSVRLPSKRASTNARTVAVIIGGTESVVVARDVGGVNGMGDTGFDALVSDARVVGRKHDERENVGTGAVRAERVKGANEIVAARVSGQRDGRETFAGALVALRRKTCVGGPRA